MKFKKKTFHITIRLNKLTFKIYLYYLQIPTQRLYIGALT